MSLGSQRILTVHWLSAENATPSRAPEA